MEGIALKTRNDKDQIALRGVRVRSRLVALGQKTTVEQSFVNLEDSAVEAVYTFPLPEGAAVCHFEVVTDDRALTGQVEEAALAEDQYDEAVSDGDGAFLLEQSRPDVFTINVGNLKPKQAVTIRVTFVAELEATDSTIRLAFPTTVAPRYLNTIGMDPLQAIVEDEQVNPPHVLHVPYGLSFEMEADLGIPISAIESHSHAIQVKLGEAGTARVSLEDSVTHLDRDIVLQITLGREPKPSARASKGSDGDTFVAVTMQPQFDELDDTPTDVNEVFFVLDCSGSMDGDSIAQARRALELCLRSLSEGDRFNICRFGSTFELMSPNVLTYCQKTLDKAVSYVRCTDANLGGTEMLAPLKKLFEMRPAQGQSRQVLLLTDGQVANEDAIIDLARRHKDENRMFTFGIGVASSTHLVKSLARVTGGAAEFVSRGERIEDKVLRTFSRLCSPIAKDIELNWNDAEVVAASPEAPTAFEGDSLTLFARILGKVPSECVVKITTPTGPSEWRIPIPEPSSDNDAIATLWAHQRIRYLEAARSPERLPSRANRRQNKELVRLSKEFGILCSQTSFIALEHRSLEERNDGQPAFRRVPVMLASDWGGITGLESFNRQRPHLIGSLADILLRSTGPACYCRSGREPLLDRFARDISSTRAIRAPVFDDPLLTILAAQMADGSFEWQNSFEEVAKEAGFAAEQCRDGVADVLRDVEFKQSIPDRSRLIDTLVVLVLLATRYHDQQTLWQRAYRKAIRFIRRNTGRPKADVELWLSGLKLASLKSAAQA